MRSLRTRLAALLVAAIVGVVLIAAAVTIHILARDPGGRPVTASFSLQAASILRLLAGSAETARSVGLDVGPPPTPAMEAPDEIEHGSELVHLGSDVRLVRMAGGEVRLAVPLAGEDWLYLPYFGQPPSPIRLLTAYLGLVVAGAVAVSLYAASRIVGPMQLLQTALERVRPDGTLAPIPERGPAEVKATARALNVLSQRLGHAVESRMRLIAAAGHDLRTPMTRMRLRAEFLPEGERGTWLRDLAELDAIADSAIRLVREEVAPGAREVVALLDLLAHLAADLSEIGLPVRFEPGGVGPLDVTGEPNALRRALGNLAENAARHGGGAEIRLDRDSGEALVLIEDRGPGIPPALMDRVFEPFFRVDPARGKPEPAGGPQAGGGAGLGLAIAREIIERHGGTIVLSHREGGGLRQEVRFPLA